MLVRAGEPDDVDAAVDVWRAANTARRGGVLTPAVDEERVRRTLSDPSATLLIADDNGAVVGMAAGLQGLADDGAGPPVPGLCHISMVFVAPDRWGEGLGGHLVRGVLDRARAAGYRRAQLWTHAENSRAQRLYERIGFVRSGREKDDDYGERIWHYERDV